MRRVSLLLITVLMISSATYAQKKAKPSLSKVETTVNKGKSEELTSEEIIAAKEMIDLAAEYEKTKTKTRTWYLSGNVYKMIYQREDEISGVSKSDALKKSAMAYNKAIEIGTPTETYTVFAQQEMDNLWAIVLNDGVNAYQAGNSEDAAKFFEFTSLIRPTDTTGYLYAAAAANDAKQYERAVKNYKKLAELNPKEDTYATIISLEKDYLKDNDAAQKTIEEAKAALGEENATIGKYEIDLLISTNQVDNALEKIEKAIAIEPNNAKLHLRKGLLYDQLASKESRNDEVDKDKLNKYLDAAEVSYKKTLELDDKDITAYFNYSVIISNRANIYFKEVNMMTPSEFNRTGKALQDKGFEFLKQAVPFMEKAQELAPEDKDVLFALQSFYTRLKSKEKLEAVNKRIEELGLN